MLRIGFAYNLKEPSTKGTDTHAEYETPDTIDAISDVLSLKGGVVPLPCDESFITRITEERPDILFNIAEGWGNRDRESFAPVICSMLGIPCTGSDAVTLGITMDKALTKRIARDAGIRTSEFELYYKIPDAPPSFGFPAFVKPNCDGSSRGIYNCSLVKNMEALVERIAIILNDYNQPALVENYIEGRDFCIGILGNNPPYTLTTCEVLLGHEDDIPFFSYEYKRHDTDRLDMTPAINRNRITEMENMALTVWNVLECRDYARFDFRTDKNGLPYLLEVNALPGLSTVSGIFVRQAAASGISFKSLILAILERSLSSFGMNK